MRNIIIIIIIIIIIFIISVYMNKYTCINTTARLYKHKLVVTIHDNFSKHTVEWLNRHDSMF